MSCRNTARRVVKCCQFEVDKYFLIVSIVVIIGCAETAGDRQVDTRPVDSADELEDSQPNDLVKAGYGIELCHIGMSIKKLDSGWESDPEPELRDILKVNKQLGICVTHNDDAINRVSFYYISEDLKPFRGGVQLGISARSTIDDVKEKYGVPSYILKTIRSDFGEFPNATETVVDYVEQGIRFNFIDDRLLCVSVDSPKMNFDYDGFENAMHDSLIFIRDSHIGAEKVPGTKNEDHLGDE